MAILKNTTLVNSGNTGWTRTNVLDALEEAIGDLGWHSGSQTNGIVTTCHAPGRTEFHTYMKPWMEVSGTHVTLEFLHGKN